MLPCQSWESNALQVRCQVNLPVGDAEFFPDIEAMPLYRLQRNAEEPGDLFAPETVLDQVADLDLSRRQPQTRVREPPAEL